MNREQIRKELIKILIAADESKKEKAENCTDDMKLTTDFGLASVGMLYMVISIEETFDIRFDDVGVSDFETLGDVVDYIEGKL